MGRFASKEGFAQGVKSFIQSDVLDKAIAGGLAAGAGALLAPADPIGQAIVKSGVTVAVRGGLRAGRVIVKAFQDDDFEGLQAKLQHAGSEVLSDFGSEDTQKMLLTSAISPVLGVGAAQLAPGMGLTDVAAGLGGAIGGGGQAGELAHKGLKILASHAKRKHGG